MIFVFLYFKNFFTLGKNNSKIKSNQLDIE